MSYIIPKKNIFGHWTTFHFLEGKGPKVTATADQIKTGQLGQKVLRTSVERIKNTPFCCLGLIFIGRHCTEHQINHSVLRLEFMK